MHKGRLFLIDATAFCYRAFFAIKGLSTSFGQPTGAVYGFVNMLHKILKEKKPDYLAICFDVSRETFRQEKFKEYKIHRPTMPDDLSNQIPIIKQIIKAFNLAIFEKQGFEADDVVATLAKKTNKLGLKVTIVSSDKDIMQLVDDDVNVFSPYKDEGVLYDTEKIRARYGVDPEHIVDIIALMGDAVDNIPGVKGIGEKTAVSLIKKFNTVDNLLNNIDKVESEKLRNTLKENLENIKLSQELAMLNDNVPVDFALERLKVGAPDYPELFRLFKYLEFKSFLKEIPLQECSPSKTELDLCQAEELEPDNLKEIIISDTTELSLLTADKKIFKIKSLSDNIKAILSGADIKKVGYDLKRLKLSLLRQGINFAGLYFDIMLAAYLINPSRPEYSLNELAWEYLKTAYPDKHLNSVLQAELVYKLRPILSGLLEEKSLSELFYNLEMPLVDVLTDMEYNGISLDIKVLKKLSGEIEERLIKLIAEIYELCGCQFNLNSPKQISDVLFNRLKLPIIKKTKTGASTNEEVLKVLAKQHKLPLLLLEYRQLTKLKNTYIDVLPGIVNPATGRIHTSFNQTGTETGRLSSSEPNLQNIPMKTDIGKKIRKAIVPSQKDDYLLSCDYSQIELRILAHISKDKNLIQGFREDKDIHKFTAALLYNIEEKAVTDEMREVAKRVNFGIVYGLSPYGLASDLGISQDEARQFIEAYFVRYPKVKDYIEDQIARARKDGFVTTILGRRRYLPEINNRSQGIRQFAERQAMNTPIQGSAADLIKLAMVEIYRKLKEKRLKTKMVLQVHDELLFETPKDELKQAKALIKDSMENVLKLDLPIKVNIKRGENWLEMEDIL